MPHQPPSFNHPHLLILLAIANIPSYIVFGRFTFGDWQSFFSSVRSIGIVAANQRLNRYTPRRLPPTDQVTDAFYEGLRLLFFVLGLLACIGAQYYLCAWLFFR